MLVELGKIKYTCPVKVRATIVSGIVERRDFVECSLGGLQIWVWIAGDSSKERLEIAGS